MDEIVFILDEEGNEVKFKKIIPRPDHPSESWQEYRDIDSKWHKTSVEYVYSVFNEYCVYDRTILVEKMKRAKMTRRIRARTYGNW